MSNVDNYKLLIRNLRKKYNEKLIFQTTADSVKYPKVGKSIHVQKEIQFNNGK